MKILDDLTHPLINIEANWTEFREILIMTGREGTEEFVAYLETTDARTAPASSKYHLSCKGGLIEHSLNVYRYIHEESKQHQQLHYEPASLTLVALLHDICKVGYYKLGEEWNKEYKEATNQWRKKQVWKVDEEAPLGHGEKSAIIANRYVDLYTEELAAIRWHMTMFDPGTHFFYPSGRALRSAMDKYPLIKLLSIADQRAELFESYYYDTVD